MQDRSKRTVPDKQQQSTGDGKGQKGGGDGGEKGGVESEGSKEKSGQRNSDVCRVQVGVLVN